MITFSGETTSSNIRTLLLGGYWGRALVLYNEEICFLYANITMITNSNYLVFYIDLYKLGKYHLGCITCLHL